MSSAVITLTTDFGLGSPYVPAMKGVILGIHPEARIIDLSHLIPPQDIRYTAYFLAAAIPYFAIEALHVVVVDPGVGTARDILHVEVAGHRLLVPDNGCWSALAQQLRAAPIVHRVAERRFWRSNVSHTFHGRDIFAPVAAHLSRGVTPAELGPQVQQWLELEPLPCEQDSQGIHGRVEFIDSFGNLITNIPAAILPAGPLRITVAGMEAPRRVHSYAEAPGGTLIALVSSTDRLEIAINQGNAASYLNARVGDPVVVVPTEDRAAQD